MRSHVRREEKETDLRGFACIFIVGKITASKNCYCLLSPPSSDVLVAHTFPYALRICKLYLRREWHDKDDEFPILVVLSLPFIISFPVKFSFAVEMLTRENVARVSGLLK